MYLMLDLQSNKFCQSEMLSRATKVFTFRPGLPRNVNVPSAFQHFHKSSSEIFIFPSVNKRITEGVQASCHVVNDKLVRPTFWMSDSFPKKRRHVTTNNGMILRRHNAITTARVRLAFISCLIRCGNPERSACSLICLPCLRDTMKM